MRALRRPKVDAVPVRRLEWPWLATAAACMLLVTVALSWVFRSGHDRNIRSIETAGNGVSALAAANTALDLGGRLPETASGAIVNPMNQELESLQQDLDSAARLLLASVP